MPSSQRNWAAAVIGSVIDYNAAKASRERQERVFAERKARRRREREAAKLQADAAVKASERKKAKKAFQQSGEWAKVRYKALKRDGGRCLLCGRTAKDGVGIHVDHIKPKSKYPELALVLSNLQVLCSECNEGKGASDETDWH